MHNWTLIYNWPLHLLRLSLCFSLWFSFSLCQAQVLHWAKDFSSSIYSIVNDIQVGPDKMLYVVGSFEGTCDFDPGPGVWNITASSAASDLYIGKYDTTGAPIWITTLEGPGYERANRIVVDRNMNIIITGIYTDTPDMDPGPGVYNLPVDGITNAFVAKYNAVGGFLWANPINSLGWDAPYALAVEGDDHVLVAGLFEDSLDFDPGPGVEWRTCVGQWDMYLVRYDRFGNLDWVYTAGGAGDDIVYSIEPDEMGKIIIGGLFADTVDFDPGPGLDVKAVTGYSDMFWTEFDTAGNYLGNTFTLGGTGNDAVSQVAYDPAGNFVVSGAFEGTVDFDPGPGVSALTSAGAFYDLFFAKYGPAGNLLYVKPLSTTGMEAISEMEVDAAGDILLTGFFPYDMDLDPSADTLWVTSAGMRDIYLAKYANASGDLLWGFGTGSAKQDGGVAIALDGLGHIYLGGTYNDTVDFDPHAGSYLLGNPTTDDFGYIAKYRDEIITATQPAVPAGEGLTLFPNPTTGHLTLTSETALGICTILDATGRVILTQDLHQAHRATLGLHNLPAGLYLLQTTQGTQRFIKH